MTEAERSICESAIAYLKVEETNEDRKAIKLSAEDSPVLRNLGNGLLVAYLYEHGDHFGYVQHRHLAREKCSEQQLNVAGMRNLSALLEKKLNIQKYGNIFAVFVDGNFEASAMLVDWLWDKGVAHTVKRGFIAALPTRDVFAFCDAGSSQGVEELRQLIARASGKVDHPLSQQLYRRQGAGWQVYADA